LEIGIDVVLGEVKKGVELRIPGLFGQRLPSIGHVVKKIQNIVGIQICEILVTVFIAKFLYQSFICPDGVVPGIGSVVI
jgi:hypothetical protein